MGMPVVTVAAGGLPVVDVSAGAAATYATLDPATVTAVTLSGGNLVATNTGTTSADQGVKVASASSKNAGKYYFEATWATITSGIGSNSSVGVGTPASTYTNMGNGGTTGVVNYVGGSIYANGSNTGITSGTTWFSGNVDGIAVDLDNRKIWFRSAPSGNWNNNAGNNPVTNVGGITIPAGAMVPFITFGGTGGAAGNVMTANFGALAFTGAVPSGFTAGWPDAAAAAPISAFGTPVTEAANGYGLRVTKVATFGTPVVYETIGVVAPVVWATWNPADKSVNVALTNGNLAATGSTTNASCRATSSKTSGKYYFEATWTGSNFSVQSGAAVGIVTSTGNVSTGFTSGPSALVRIAQGMILYNGSDSGMATSALAPGGVHGVAVDLDNKRIWFRNNAGLWNGSGAANPATNTGGLDISSLFTANAAYPAFSGHSVSSTATTNFGASSFTGAVPAGFTAGWPA